MSEGAERAGGERRPASRGNPFYLEQLARDGARHASSTFRPTDQLGDSWMVPPGVIAAIPRCERVTPW